MDVSEEIKLAILLNQFKMETVEELKENILDKMPEYNVIKLMKTNLLEHCPKGTDIKRPINLSEVFESMEKYHNEDNLNLTKDFNPIKSEPIF
jgi:hypothetical protein